MSRLPAIPGRVSEPVDGFFQWVCLVELFGFGVTGVNLHERAPEVREALEMDALGFTVAVDGTASVGSAERAAGEVESQGVLSLSAGTRRSCPVKIRLS